jgi:uncharacterized membrane protein YdjX (TVP38/TMEM64 family)
VAPPRKGSNPLGRIILTAVGLLAAIYIIRKLGSGNATEWVDELVKDQGLIGEAIFVAIGIAATAAGVPRQGIAFLAGYAFAGSAYGGHIQGALLATGLALLAQLGGGGIAFLWAREIGQGWAQDRLEGRFGRRLRPLQNVLMDSPFSSILALRLVPIGNNLALNLLAGVAGVGFLPFILASAIGYLPQTLIFVLIGQGLYVEQTTQLGVAVGLFTLSAIIGFTLLRRHRAARALDTEVQEERIRDPFL